MDSINWLKHNIDPEITLYKLWAETASYRLQKQSNDKNNLKYPALKNSKGHILVSSTIYIIEYVFNWLILILLLLSH